MLNFAIRFLQKLNWSLRYKLGLAFALLLFCFVVDGLVSILLLLNIQSIDNVQKTNFDYLQKLQYTQLTFNNKVAIYQNDIFVTKSNAVLDNFRLTFDFSDPDPDYQKFEKTFSQLYGQAFNDFVKLNSFLQTSNFEGAATKWQEVSPHFDAINKLLNDRQQFLQNNLVNAQGQLSSTVTLSISLIVFITLFCLIMAVVLLVLLDGLFVQPVNRLQVCLQKVAEGDLDQRIEVPNQDEVGRLAYSFDSAVKALQKVFQSVQIGEGLKSVAVELSGASQQQASYASQQVSAMGELLAVLQELGQTASQIASSATRVSQKTDLTLEQIKLVEDAGKISQHHSQQMVNVVVNTLTGIEKVGTQVEAISQKMLALDEQSQAIGKVVELLQNISNNVHLLSLNAAIEAAGAGAYGERFEIIAREIRELAKRSRSATVEASHLVADVQLSSREVLEQVVAGQQEVQSVVQSNGQMRQDLQELEVSARQVGEAVVRLLLLAGEMSQEAEMIKQVTYQQHMSNQQVISTAYSVSDVAQETVTVSQNVATNSSHLESMALQLNKVLSQVKLEAA